MNPVIERVSAADLPPATWLMTHGSIFATFDARTQDSGNISFGIDFGGTRYFVKTAGDPDGGDSRPEFDRRVRSLRNAVRLSQSCAHPLLVRVQHVVESPAGPMLFYEWVDGDLLYSREAERGRPESPLARFRALPLPNILAHLTDIFDLHEQLERVGWIAVDFYDGCLLYCFENDVLRVIDLDEYRYGPTRNDVGRMFGSSRFMAPEQFIQGEVIDGGTSVFTMGRLAMVMLSVGASDPPVFRGSQPVHAVVTTACRQDRAERYASVKEFKRHWDAAVAARG